MDLKPKVSYMTAEQVRADVLAKNEGKNVEVYDWEVTRLEKAVPMETVAGMVTEVRKRYMEVRAANPADDDDVIRERLMAADPKVRSFGADSSEGGTHHVLFLKLTNRDTPPEHLKVVAEMIMLRAKHEASTSGVEAHSAEISQYFSTRVKDVTTRFPVKEPNLFHVDKDPEEESKIEEVQAPSIKEKK